MKIKKQIVLQIIILAGLEKITETFRLIEVGLREQTGTDYIAILNNGMEIFKVLSNAKDIQILVDGVDILNTPGD